MNKNEKFVITINRELGSGGRTIGRKLAEKLGVQFFDKALLMALEEKYHLTAEEIENLKAMPDAQFDELTDAQIKEIDRRTENALAELRRWGFVRREA